MEADGGSSVANILGRWSHCSCVDGTDTMVLNFSGRGAEKAYRDQIGLMIISSGKPTRKGQEMELGVGMLRVSAVMMCTKHGWAVVRIIGTE